MPLPTSSIGRKLLAFRKVKPVCVIDFDGSFVRIVQAAPSRNGARITRVASAKLEAADPASRGLALRKALAEVGVKTKHAIFVVPRGPVVLRTVQVPAGADVRELAAVVHFQITKDLPFRPEDAVIDFKILRKVSSSATAESPGEEKLELLVGAVQRQAILDLQQTAKAAGLKVSAIGLRSAGHARAAKMASGTAPDAKALAIVACGHDETTFDVAAGVLLAFSRVVATGVPADSSAAALEGFAGNLGVEVVRSLHGYEGMMWHLPVDRVLVAGPEQDRVARLLAERFDGPVEAVDLGRALVGERVDLAEAAAAFGAIGLACLALETGGLSLDFANPKRPPVARNTARIKTIAAAAAVVLVLIGVLVFRAKLIRQRTMVRNAVQEQLTDAEKKLPIYRKLKAQAKIVNGWLGEELNWLDHFAYLSAVLPSAEQVYISALNTTPQHAIRFSVQARSGELLAELDKNLRAAGYEVKPLSITPATDKYGYNFRTTVELTIPKKLKIDLSKVKFPARPFDDISSSVPGRPVSRANPATRRGNSGLVALAGNPDADATGGDR